MARRHGRNGRLLISLDGTAAPSLAAFIKDYDVSFKTDRDDATSFQDSNKTYTQGLPDFTGNISGFFDLKGGSASGQTDAIYKAATDGIARGFYLYFDTTTTTTDYLYGTVFLDFSIRGSVSGTIEFSASMAAAGPVTLK